jgi:hypothetical protein
MEQIESWSLGGFYFIIILKEVEIGHHRFSGK